MFPIRPLQIAQRRQADMVYIAILILLLWGLAVSDIAHETSRKNSLTEAVGRKKNKEEVVAESTFGSLSAQSSIKLPPELSLFTQKRRDLDDEEYGRLRTTEKNEQ